MAKKPFASHFYRVVFDDEEVDRPGATLHYRTPFLATFGCHRRGVAKRPHLVISTYREDPSEVIQVRLQPPGLEGFVLTDPVRVTLIERRSRIARIWLEKNPWQIIPIWPRMSGWIDLVPNHVRLRGEAVSRLLLRRKRLSRLFHFNPQIMRVIAAAHDEMRLDAHSWLDSGDIEAYMAWTGANATFWGVESQLSAFALNWMPLTFPGSDIDLDFQGTLWKRGLLILKDVMRSVFPHVETILLPKIRVAYFDMRSLSCRVPGNQKKSPADRAAGGKDKEVVPPSRSGAAVGS